MTLVVIEGPEKAGKTTLCSLLCGRHPEAGYRHWGPVDHPEEYRGPLLRAVYDDKLHVWDRSWFSGLVYDRLLPQQSNRWAWDPWLWEWLYGFPLHSYGLGLVLLGPDPGRRRTPDDLPILPAMERREFQRAAEDYPLWRVVPAGRQNLDLLESIAYNLSTRPPAVLPPTDYVGPPRPQVLFVEEPKAAPAGALCAAFTSPGSLALPRWLGPPAWLCGWTNSTALARLEPLARESLLEDTTLLVRVNRDHMQPYLPPTITSTVREVVPFWAEPKAFAHRGDWLLTLLEHHLQLSGGLTSLKPQSM